MKTHERRRQIKTMLAQGYTVAATASKLGVARSTVHRATTSPMAKKGNQAGYLVVSTRVTERERSGLDRLVSEEKGETRGQVLRKLVRHGADYYAPNAEEEAFLEGALAHLAKLGGNFNQIAAALSASVKKIGEADPSAEQAQMMRDAADEVAVIKKVIQTMLINAQVRTGTLQERLGRPAYAEEDADG